MGYQFVNFQTKNKVAVIELVSCIDGQDQLIRLNEEISDCCEKFRVNDGNSVLVITEGVPGKFVIEGSLAFEEGFPEYVTLSQSIAECKSPVLIGIKGDAVDLGLEMALACDVRIASETSRFGLCQVKAGFMPWDGGTQRLLRTIGRGKALEMILTGEPIDAEEAMRIGLVSRMVSKDEVTPVVMKMAHEMASKSSISLEYCKEAISKGMDLTLEQGLRLEADLYFLMHTTHDREEGIKAFREKRKPEFKRN